jgi:hypothetical protein
MEMFYAALFGLMAIAAAVLELGKPRESTDSNLTRDFLRFSRCDSQLSGLTLFQ